MYTYRRERSSMRNFIEVINKIIELIPLDDIPTSLEPDKTLQNRRDLVSHLKQIRYSAGYKAPEAQAYLWHEAAYVLNALLPPPTSDAPAWVREIAAVFAGRK